MRLLTIPKAAKRLGLSLHVVTELAKSRSIPVVPIKQRLLVPQDALDAWVRESIQLRSERGKAMGVIGADNGSDKAA